MASRRRFDRKFKIAAIEQVESGKTASKVASSFGISKSVLHRWRREWRKNPEGCFPGPGKPHAERISQPELERKIGQLVMENDRLRSIVEWLESHQRPEPPSGDSDAESRRYSERYHH